MPHVKTDQAEIHYSEHGRTDGPLVIWAHGWGQSRESFQPLIKPLEPLGRHIAVDFPGFGTSPPPSKDWNTADFADAMASFIRSLTDQPVLWIGHSFGCRVGLQLAARHPDLIKSLCLIAGAGLPRIRPLHERLYIRSKVSLYKTLKKLIPLGLSEDWLKSQFGSADYKAAGPMRNILIKVVNEDLSDIARTITCPVTLIYGSDDTQTPPDIGERLKELIPNADLILLPDQDHYSVLSTGRHQVLPHVKRFIEALD